MYTHRFHTRASLDAVVAFHRGAGGMAALTPPPLRVQLHAAPEVPCEGDLMDFTLRLGPFGLRWLARIEDLRPDGFTDRQLRGPFARWVHVHRFIPRADGTVAVVDTVDTALSRQPLRLLVGLAMRLSLPAFFAYRARRTRRLLEGG